MKICPLMAFNADTDILMVSNYDFDPEQIKEIKEYGVLMLRNNLPEPTIEILRGTCKEADCAWWSEERKCCGVVR